VALAVVFMGICTPWSKLSLLQSYNHVWRT
jgi:hypothetical protein